MRTLDRISTSVKFAVQDVLQLNAASEETLMGTDHAHYDFEYPDGTPVPIDYDTAYFNGSRFAIIKIVNGAVIQRNAPEEFARARASKVRSIPYMWPYPVKYISAALQAEKYYEVMKNYPGVAIALDAEPTPGYPNPQGSDHEAVIREYWKNVPSQLFVFYSNYYYIMENGFNTDFFAQFPLWLSRPGTNAPVVPSAWSSKGKTWTIWQNSWTLPPAPYGVTSGKSVVDGNIMRARDFESIFGDAPVIEPPPSEDKMYQVTIVYPDGANIRSAPVVSSSTYLRTVGVGTIFQTDYPETTDAAGNRWIRVKQSPEEWVCTYYGSLRASVETLVLGDNPKAHVTFTDADGKNYAGDVELLPQ